MDERIELYLSNHDCCTEDSPVDLEGKGTYESEKCAYEPENQNTLCEGQYPDMYMALKNGELILNLGDGVAYFKKDGLKGIRELNEEDLKFIFNDPDIKLNEKWYAIYENGTIYLINESGREFALDDDYFDFAYFFPELDELKGTPLKQAEYYAPTLHYASDPENADEKSRGLAGKVVAGIALGTFLVASLAGCVAPNKIMEEEEKLKKTPIKITIPTQTPTVSPSETPAPVSPIVSYCEKLGLSEEIINKIKEKLGVELSEDKKKVIDIIAEVEGKNYVPAGIREFVPPSHGEREKAEVVGKILEGVMSDGKMDNAEKTAIKYFFSLPEEVQKAYIEKHSFSSELVGYLNLLTQIKDEKFKRYVSETQFGFADGKLDETERKFLESGGKDVNNIIDHYLRELLAENPSITKELQKLPEFKRKDINTAEALEDILALVKQSEPYEKFEDRFNPEKITPAREVYEAFELMVKGGRIQNSRLPYPAPNFNSQLYILWKLAEKNEFKNYDTLALSVAIDEGFPYAIGDHEVKRRVIEDANKWFNFLRETSSWQKLAKFKYNLEKYPLEAKILLAMRNVHYADFKTAYPNAPEVKLFPEGFDHPKFDPASRPLDISSYEWHWIDEFDNLLKLRKKLIDILNIRPEVVLSDGELGKNIDKRIYAGNKYWDHPYPEYSNRSLRESNEIIKKLREKMIDVDGKSVVNFWIYNPDFEVRYFLVNNKGIGVCVDYEVFAKACAKSLGIAEFRMDDKFITKEGGVSGHTYPAYYDSIKEKWIVADKLHSRMMIGLEKLQNSAQTYNLRKEIMRPPIDIQKIISDPKDPRLYFWKKTDIEMNKNELTEGFSTNEIKKALLYSDCKTS